MLSQYNIGYDYRQSQTDNLVTFSNCYGWEKASDVDVQSFEGSAKNILNSNVEYLR